MRTCTKCGISKPISEFYNAPKNTDKLSKACKDCLKKQSKELYDRKIKDDEFRLQRNEKARHFARSGKRKKYKQSKEYSIKIKNSFPEKMSAYNKTRCMSIAGKELHHWSYNKEHHKDIIYLDRKDHRKAHRFMIYDQEQMMYRRFDNNILLDNKEAHVKFINYCLKKFKD